MNKLNKKQLFIFSIFILLLLIIAIVGIWRIALNNKLYNTDNDEITPTSFSINSETKSTGSYRENYFTFDKSTTVGSFNPCSCAKDKVFER